MPQVKVKYRCQHISCRNPKCYEKQLSLDQEVYDLLFDTEQNPRFMRSPTGYCTLGNPQVFEILSQEFEDESKLSPQSVLRMLYSRLDKTERAKANIDQQYRKIVEMQKKAESNVAELKKRISDTEALMSKGEE